MQGGLGIEVTGLRELIKTLRTLDAGLLPQLKAIHLEIAQPIAAAASSRAPRISGALSDTIRAQGTQKVARVAAGKQAVPYAGPIHWGWPSRGIRAQPFLLDAFEANADRSLEQYETSVAQFLKAVAGG